MRHLKLQMTSYNNKVKTVKKTELIRVATKTRI